jgi:hypothetical protein
MLSIHSQAITFNIEATINRAQHTRPIRDDYYCKQFMWLPKVFDLTDWAVHAVANTKIPRTRSFFNKFGSFLDPDLLAISQIGLKAFFTDSPPDFEPPNASF